VRIRKSYKFSPLTKKDCTLTLIGNGDTYLKKVSGFKRRDNAFESGLGAVKQQSLTTFADIKRTFCSPNSGNLFLVADGGAYLLYKGDSDFVKFKDGVADDAFFADMYIDGKAATVLYNGKDRVVFYNGFSNASDLREFYDGVLHCGRFFARDKAEGLKILWSSGDPMEWASGIDGCGYIYLPTDGGNVLRLFNYNEKLVAVRERGITVISAYGEPQHYAVKSTASYLTCDGVIAETCAVCDGKLFFCTKSGIFAFDGDDIERQENGHDFEISAYKSAVAVGDRYFILCDGEAYGEGALFVYETVEGSGYFAGVNCLKLIGGDALYAFCKDGVYTFEENSASGSWQSLKLNFGANGAKFLKEVYLECEGECGVSAECDGVVRSFGKGRNRADMFGREFSFCVSGKGRVTRLTATAEVRGDI
jgi:hypothetical protein